MRASAVFVAMVLVLAMSYALWPTTHSPVARLPTAKRATPMVTPAAVRIVETIAVAESDDAACVKEMRALMRRRPSEVTEAEISDLAGRWARLNPSAAFAWAAALTDERLHPIALSQVLEVWNATQPRAAITALLQSALPASEQNSRLQLAVTTWCMMEPAAAQQWLASVVNDELKTSLLIAAVEHMDAEWATYWLSYAATFPDAAAAEDRTALGKMLVNALSRQDPRATTDYIFSQARATGNYALAIEAFAAWVRQDAVSAATYASHTGSLDEQKMIIPALVRQWSQQDAASASRWAASLPEGKVKELAMEQSLQAWAQAEPALAADFLLRSARGPAHSRDVAVSGLATRVAGVDPQSAYEWARTIHAPGQRETVLTRVLSTWLATDEAAALPYLQGAGLSEKARQEALFHAGEIRQTAQSGMR